MKSQLIVTFLVVVVSTALCMPVLLGLVRRMMTTMAAEYVSGTHSMAFVTVPNKEVAKKIASGLVERKIAACVNIIPGISSVYEWEGKIEEDDELLLMIKTRTNRVNEITNFVKENHPYDVPEVISAPIDQGNPDYLKWLGEIVQGKK